MSKLIKSKSFQLALTISMLVWATLLLKQQYDILSRIEELTKQSAKLNATIDETLRPLTAGEINP